MAIAYDSTASYATSGSNVTNPTWSHTCSGSDRVLVVICTDPNNGANHDSATYGGQAMTKAVESAQYGGGSTSVWYLINPPTGSNTVSFNGGTTRWMCGSISYTGADVSDISDGTCSNGGTSISATSCSITTSRDKSVIIGGGGGTGNFTWSAANGLTQRYNVQDGITYHGVGGTEQKVTAGAEITGISASGTADRMTYAAMAIKEKVSFIPRVTMI